MNDPEKQIKELAEATEQIRYQFLLTELQTCFTSLEMALLEISIGSITHAKREVSVIEEGIRTIERFIPKVSLKQRPELERKLAELKEAFHPVAAELAGETG
jgi:hypothetical protein